jgi:hypothetical protein
MIGEAIVTFIDILGYKALITKHMKDIEVIKGIESIIGASTIKLIEKIRNKPFVNQVYEEYKKQIGQVIRVKVITDAIIFTLPISEIIFANPVEKEATVTDCLHLYFDSITMFCTLFISHIGYVLRGGMAIGPHYESNLQKEGNNFFIFSNAYIDASVSEKEAIQPRIIVNDKLISYLHKKSFKYMDDYFYKGEDGKTCFDFYAHLSHYSNRRVVLSAIKEGVELNLRENKLIKKNLSKLIYFAEYHNRKVNKDNLNCEDLFIDIGKFQDN